MTARADLFALAQSRGWFVHIRVNPDGTALVTAGDDFDSYRSGGKDDETACANVLAGIRKYEAAFPDAPAPPADKAEAARLLASHGAIVTLSEFFFGPGCDTDALGVVNAATRAVRERDQALRRAEEAERNAAEAGAEVTAAALRWTAMREERDAARRALTAGEPGALRSLLDYLAETQQYGLSHLALSSPLDAEVLAGARLVLGRIEVNDAG